MKKHVFLFILFFLSFTFSCKKEASIPPVGEIPPIVSSSHLGKGLTVASAQDLFTRVYGDESERKKLQNSFEATNENGCVVLEPIWFLAKDVKLADGSNLITVPIKMPNNVVNDTRGMQLVFYADETCETPMELVIYEARAANKMDNCSFSGPVIKYDFCNCSMRKYSLNDGQIIASEEFLASESIPECKQDIGLRNPVKCPWDSSFWDWLGNIFENVGDWFEDIFDWWMNHDNNNNDNDENNNGGNNGGTTIEDGGTFFDHYGGSNVTGGGGGGSTTLNSVFDGNFFNGQGQQVLNKLNQIIDAHDLFVCVEDLHTDLYHCLATNHNDPEEQCGGFHISLEDPNANPNIDELTLPEYIAFLNSLSLHAPDCLEEIENTYGGGNMNMGPDDGELLCLVKANDYGEIPDEVVFELIQDNGCYVNGTLNQECVDDVLLDYVVNLLQNELNLSPTQIDWILDENEENSAYAFEVFNYIENNNLEHQSAAKEAAKIYLKLLQNDSEFAELNAQFAAIPSFVWPFIREVAVEVAIELIKKHVPGVSDYSNVIDAINNLQQGDMLGFLGEVLDIVKKKFPALAVIDLAIDGYELTGIASKAWKAYSKMEQFGSDAIEKFTQVLASKAGGILGKFQWINNSIGAKIFDVGDPQTFVDDLMDLFPNVQGPYFLNPIHPLEQTYYVGSLTIKFYPVSNTTGGPTLSFIGSPDFKIRFP